MGFIALLKQFFKTERKGTPLSEAIVDPGYGNNSTATVFAPAGDHANPLPGDYAALFPVRGSGRVVVVGWSDAKVENTTKPGERRLYSRTASGQVAAEIYISADGSIEIKNGSGGITLKADGAVDINGAQITAEGEIINAKGINLSEHRHGGVQAGSAVTRQAQ